MIANKPGIVRIQKSVRTVVEGKADDREIIGVHHAVRKADALPSGHEFRRAFYDGAKETLVTILAGTGFGEPACDRVVRQRLNCFDVLAIVEKLERTKAH